VHHSYYVYILASKSRVLCIGVTNGLHARVCQHRGGELDGFTNEYKVHRLVYFERHAWIQNAIVREKQLKRWRREKKVWLIERENPTWEDLSAEWDKPPILKFRDPAISDAQQVPPLCIRPPAKHAAGKTSRTLRSG